MKKNKRFTFVLGLALLSIPTLAGCNTQSSFTIQFVNYDGSLLEKYVNVERDAKVSYSGSKPVHFEDDTSYYVFKGWDQEITKAEKDVTYTAVFDAYPVTDVEETPDGYIDVLPSDNKDGTILHAFCWKYSDIASQLPYIKEAGYKMVQTSPVQTPKGNGSSWWAFYQPLSFNIADNGDSPLGDKQDLKDLCSEAEKYGIDIIVDIVFNHLGNIGDSALEPDGTPKVSPQVEKYEPYIYQHRNDEVNPTFHHNKNAEGSGAETQYYAFGALPDLNTGNEYVQSRALDLLKECIDVGVDGFRFDAAKHIESPEDPEYPSDFWPNTLGVAKEYYKQQNSGKELFAYGEVLGSPKGRSVDVYTKYMKVTDGSYCDGIVNGASNKDASRAAKAKYGQNTATSNLVGWLESHDTYVEDKNPWSNTFMARNWAILNTRKDYVGLYLARPDAQSPSVGLIGDYFFRDNTLGAINRFHNRFIGADEVQSADGSIYVMERFTDTEAGAVVVDFNGSKRVVVDFTKLGTGVYYEQITGQKIVVRNNHATVKLADSGVAILTKSKNEARPYFETSSRGELFVDEMTVDVDVYNGTGSYSINGKDAVTFEKATSINFARKDAVDGKVELTIKVANSQFETEETFTFKVADIIEGYLNILNVKEEYFTDYEIYMWSWNDSGSHWSKDYQVQDNIILVDTDALNIKGGDSGLLLAIFEKGYVITEPNKWDENALRQTTNISGKYLEQGYYDGSNF